MWSWFDILGLILGPFYVGVIFEDKLQQDCREIGSRLLRRS
jgi:hypothetical protein